MVAIFYSSKFQYFIVLGNVCNGFAIEMASVMEISLRWIALDGCYWKHCESSVCASDIYGFQVFYHLGRSLSIVVSSLRRESRTKGHISNVMNYKRESGGSG